MQDALISHYGKKSVSEFDEVNYNQGYDQGGYEEVHINNNNTDLPSHKVTFSAYPKTNYTELFLNFFVKIFNLFVDIIIWFIESIKGVWKRNMSYKKSISPEESLETRYTNCLTNKQLYTTLFIFTIFISYFIISGLSVFLKNREQFQYIDRYNKTIEKPLFIFDDFNDISTLNKNIKFFFDHYDKALVSYIAELNSMGEAEVTLSDLRAGYKKLPVYGYTTEQIIGFEISERSLSMTLDKKDGCVALKNFGIPIDILMLEEEDNDVSNNSTNQKKRTFMIQPKIIDQNHRKVKTNYDVKIYDSLTSDTYKIKKYDKEIIPKEIKVQYYEYSKNPTILKERIFSGKTAMCIIYSIK